MDGEIQGIVRLRVVCRWTRVHPLTAYRHFTLITNQGARNLSSRYSPLNKNSTLLPYTMSSNTKRSGPPKKDSILELAKLMDATVRVKCLGGRELQGTLRGYDELVNLVLDDCDEFLRGECQRYSRISAMFCKELTVICLFRSGWHGGNHGQNQKVGFGGRQGHAGFVGISTGRSGRNCESLLSSRRGLKLIRPSKWRHCSMGYGVRALPASLQGLKTNNHSNRIDN